MLVLAGSLVLSSTTGCERKAGPGGYAGPSSGENPRGFSRAAASGRAPPPHAASGQGTGIWPGALFPLALVAAGAEIVWVGHAEPWKKMPGVEDIARLEQVSLVPLDLSNARSVDELAGEIGGKVDIVINNAELHRGFGIAARHGTDGARAEMDINYFGPLRMAEALGAVSYTPLPLPTSDLR